MDRVIVMSLPCRILVCVLSTFLAPQVVAAFGVVASNETTAPTAPKPASSPRQIDEGFVYIGGLYLPPPYVVRSTAAGIKINEHLIVAAPPKPASQSPKQKQAALTKQRAATRRLISHLDAGLTVVAWSGTQPCFLDRDHGAELLQLLVAPARPTPAQVAQHSWLPTGDIREQWIDWIISAPASDPDTLALLVERAPAELQWFANWSEQYRRAVDGFAWEKRLNTISYPLTVLAMLTVTFAVGHLLQTHLLLCQSSESADGQAAARAVAKSLLLIAVCGAQDLLWTILAAKSNLIVELNPVGSRFIHDPVQLLLLKSSLTLLGLGLLFAFRAHPIARRSTWWLTLVSLLLTVRWVAFSGVVV